jgi:hypothetical protein
MLKPWQPIRVSFKVFPNPANSSTRVNVTLPMAAQVTIEPLQHVLGQRAGGSQTAHYEAGTQSIPWGGDDLPGGIYMITLTFDSGQHHAVETQKIVVAR